MRRDTVGRCAPPCAWLALALSSSWGLLGCFAPRLEAPRRASAEHYGARALTFKNDAFTDSDHDRTNDIGLGRSTDEVKTYDNGGFVRLWTDYSTPPPLMPDEGHLSSASWIVGQEMYACGEFSNPDPSETDQPYAAYLDIEGVLAGGGDRWEHGLALSPAWGLLGCSTPQPEEPSRKAAEHGGALTLTIENDSFTGSDNNYSNGIGLGWSTDEVGTYGEGSFVRGWADIVSFLPFVRDEGYLTYASWTIGQEMHTPDDISDPDPPETDQPYAGVLYLDSVLAARAHHWEHRWSLRLGVVGPASQADETQEWVHDLVGADEPMGWNQQLPNEPLLNVGYDAAYLLAEQDLGGSAKCRLVPTGGAAVGNYFTGANIGLYGEVGWNLVDAFGVSSLRGGFDTATTIGVGPVEGWSFSFFASASGFGVVHYLPLDGTVFRDSRSVDSEPFVGSATFGLTLRTGRFVLGLATTYTTDSFETQTENAEFGTVSLSWFF